MTEDKCLGTMKQGHLPVLEDGHWPPGARGQQGWLGQHAVPVSISGFGVL